MQWVRNSVSYQHGEAVEIVESFGGQHFQTEADKALAMLKVLHYQLDRSDYIVKTKRLLAGASDTDEQSFDQGEFGNEKRVLPDRLSRLLICEDPSAEWKR